jgi:MbtH protein
MTPKPGDDDRPYEVVVGHEEQYFLRPPDRDTPAGRSDAGRTGPGSDCPAHTEEMRTDTRPLSPRHRLQAGGQPAPAAPDTGGTG